MKKKRLVSGLIYSHVTAADQVFVRSAMEPLSFLFICDPSKNVL